MHQLGTYDRRVGCRSANIICCCELRRKCPCNGTTYLDFCLDVVRMPRQRTNSALDQYELAVDEIVAACDGDLRGAVRALMLLNERLELRLEQMSGVHPPHQRLH